jgi:hypothetical protein
MKPTLLIALAVAAIPGGVSAASLGGGAVILESRLRGEIVSQQGFAADAQALTLRTRFGYETPPLAGFKALMEGENVAALSGRYNSTVNGRTAYPVIADPKSNELNRAQLSWSGEKVSAVVGRQRIVLGAARHVGNVGFRQNEQTFDAARVDFRPSKDVTATYVYIDRVNRIFGENSPQGRWASDSHLAHLDLKLPAAQLTGYAYLLDLAGASAMSSATLGARLAGTRPLGGGYTATYEAEYAHQSQHGNAPTDFGLDYAALTAGLRRGAGWMTVGFEQLGGDGRRGFQTPLATLHAFQGWADVFLSTPANGVRDLNLRIGTVLKPSALPKGLRLQAALHDFAATRGSADYGREFDLLAATPLTPTLTLETKLAVFHGAGPAFPDRTKIWASLDWKL